MAFVLREQGLVPSYAPKKTTAIHLLLELVGFNPKIGATP